MADRELFRPKNPTREEILETVGNDGQNHWRNPVHLETVRGDWPKRNQDDWFGWGMGERKRINGMETNLRRNGSLK